MTVAWRTLVKLSTRKENRGSFCQHCENKRPMLLSIYCRKSSRWSRAFVRIVLGKRSLQFRLLRCLMRLQDRSAKIVQTKQSIEMHCRLVAHFTAQDLNDLNLNWIVWTSETTWTWSKELGCSASFRQTETGSTDPSPLDWRTRKAGDLSAFDVCKTMKTQCNVHCNYDAITRTALDYLGPQKKENDIELQ